MGEYRAAYKGNSRSLLPLPTDPDGLPAAHVVPWVFYAPEDAAIVAALRGSLYRPARWFAWERDNNRSGAKTAGYVKTLLEHPGDRSPAAGGLGMHQGAVAMLKSEGCTLYQSIDNGRTWHAVMDVSDCVGQAVEPLLRKQTEDFLSQLQALYDAGGIPEALPDLVYGDADDALRDVALCNAWQIFVLFLMHTELERRRGIYTTIHAGVDGIDDFVDGITNIGLVARQPGAAKAALVANTITLVVRIGLIAFQGLDEAVLSDTDAAREVACCAYQAMAGVTASSSGFRDALDNCDFGLNINAALIAGAVEYMLDDLRMFLAFLAYQRELLDLAKLGILDDCFCGPVWTHTFDFAAGDGGWTPYQAFGVTEIIAGDIATYQPDTGWAVADNRTKNQSSGNEFDQRSASILYEFAAPVQLIEMVVTFDYSKGSLADSLLAQSIQPGGSILAAAAVSGSDLTLSWHGALTRSDVRVVLRSSVQLSGWSGSGLIKSVFLRGVGADPFE